MLLLISGIVLGIALTVALLGLTRASVDCATNGSSSATALPSPLHDPVLR